MKPHRIERYMASNDPYFEARAADMIGLYLNPPAHAAVFCVDEKTASRRWTDSIQCCRSRPDGSNATALSITATARSHFNTKTGEVLGKTATRHTSAEFVAFLVDICTQPPRRKEIHVICDNLSAHKTKRVNEFLADHPNVHLHFTLTYSSWLNQVELWFAKIERNVIAHGIFTSVGDLKLMLYIRHYNRAP